MAAAQRGATLRSHWLGQQLRDLREKRGMLLKDAAQYLQRDVATLSRYETGYYPIRRPDLMALLDLYGISDAALREKLFHLSHDVWQKGWWDGYATDVTGSLIDYVWLESRARHIRTYAAIVVPGLLQTPEYAEEVIRINDNDATSEQIERWHELRMARQQILDSDEPPLFSAILDESVLLRQIGSAEIMIAQLRRLADYAARPGIDIRVLPFNAGTPASTYGTFEMFELPDPLPQVAHTETMAGALYVESPDTEVFFRTYDEHTALALSQKDSAERILAVAKEWQ
ncbi:helix-turn-helix domain-containing protein [Actinomadura atramentaria]|uniref:helix-turn-helix domain-containing protein n=1 Tax=Actinomadura atramentaria TaxID=1990 RepID=UPI000372A760|nr:helix-turn-helix transcriptional regulator [Actinomadura atramentaria]